MDVINKLYFTVSNTVSQISNALPGNAVTKEFDIYEHIGSAGPGNRCCGCGCGGVNQRNFIH